MSEDTKNKLLSRQEELMYGFQFSEADLEANREGHLTEHQRKIILERERPDWLFYYGMGIFGILFGFVTVPVIADMFKHPEDNLVYNLFVVFIICLVVGGSIYALRLGPKSRKALLQDLEDGIAKSVQGLALVDPGYRRVQATITVNEFKFKAPRDAILRVKHLEPHIFYYLPRSKIILSVEVVEQD
jgi:hypothetical protein